MGARYVRAEWIHGLEDEPRFIYSELDDERYETRKIEVFGDGRTVRVSRDKPESSSTSLADQPMPNLEEINANEEFCAQEIGAPEFEELWRGS